MNIIIIGATSGIGRALFEKDNQEDRNFDSR